MRLGTFLAIATVLFASSAWAADGAREFVVGDVVISELAPDPDGQRGAAWIEVYNGAGVPVDIGGLEIVVRSAPDATAEVRHTLVGPAPVPADGYALIAVGGAAGTAVTEAPGLLDDLASDGLYVRLEEKTGALVDDVCFGPQCPLAGAVPSFADGTTWAFLGAGHPNFARNDDPALWGPYGETAGQANCDPCSPIPMAVGDIVISEIMARGHDGPDWIELYGAAAEDRNLGRCVLGEEGNSAHTVLVSAAVPVQAGGYVVISRDPGDKTCAPEADHYIGQLDFVTGHEERIFLACPVADAPADAAIVEFGSCTYTVIDEVTMDAGAVGGAQGQSLSYCPGDDGPTAAGNDDLGSWLPAEEAWCSVEATEETDAAENFGTPGAPNTCEITPPFGPGEAVITEIAPNVQDGGEWFEVVSVADGERSLSGCWIGEGDVMADDLGDEWNEATTSELTGPMIAAGQRFIMAKTCSEEWGGELCVDYSSLDFAPSKPGALSLYCPGEDGAEPEGLVLVDRIVFSADGAHEVDKGFSWALSPDAPLDAAANDDPTNWCQSRADDVYWDGGDEPDHGTPGADNVCPPPPVYGDVVIAEIMIDGAVAGEWFEVVNVAADPRDLHGCQLTGGKLEEGSEPDEPVDLTGGAVLTLDSGERWVFARGCDKPGMPAERCSEYSRIGFLDATAEFLAIECPTGEAGAMETLDRIEYDGSALSLPDGYSWSLDPTHESAADNDDAANWCAARDEDVYDAEDARHGTPGDVNPACL